MGLSVLPYMDHITTERKRVCDYYDLHLDFSKMSKLKIRDHTDWNYAYYPVIFESEVQLLETMQNLAVHSIYPRRYFYPSLENLPYINSKQCSIADDIEKRVLCLPLYCDLTKEEINSICHLLLRTKNN
jgi:dTDP-4-amino-4,6-dideoxygalactose transaminase